jgi:hypothetical protein
MNLLGFLAEFANAKIAINVQYRPLHDGYTLIPIIGECCPIKSTSAAWIPIQGESTARRLQAEVAAFQGQNQRFFHQP